MLLLFPSDIMRQSTELMPVNHFCILAPAFVVSTLLESFLSRAENVLSINRNLVRFCVASLCTCAQRRTCLIATLAAGLSTIDCCAPWFPLRALF
jgi:hypothetical protein